MMRIKDQTKDRDDIVFCLVSLLCVCVTYSLMPIICCHSQVVFSSRLRQESQDVDCSEMWAQVKFEEQFPEEQEGRIELQIASIVSKCFHLLSLLRNQKIGYMMTIVSLSKSWISKTRPEFVGGFNKIKHNSTFYLTLNKSWNVLFFISWTSDLERVYPHYPSY
jgi:hypothetical protein